MARSSYIYCVQSFRGDDTFGVFTVKYEAVSAIRRWLADGTIRESFRVETWKDGGAWVKSTPGNEFLLVLSPSPHESKATS